MFKIIEPESLKNEGLDKKPPYYQSMANNPLQDRLGSKTTYSGFLKIVGSQDLTVTVPVGQTMPTTSPHGVISSIPFVFLYLKVAGYYTRVGFRTGSQTDPNAVISGIGNAVIDDKNFSFSITNFSAVDEVFYLRAIIFEINE